MLGQLRVAWAKSDVTSLRRLPLPLLGNDANSGAMVRYLDQEQHDILEMLIITNMEMFVAIYCCRCFRAISGLRK